jgi:hypothetical protein
MNIYNFMNQQMRLGYKGKSRIKKLNELSEINKIMKKIYLN